AVLCLFFYCLFFFFSSRRRHTRWPRDWSSDVCSSDLVALPSWPANKKNRTTRTAMPPAAHFPISKAHSGTRYWRDSSSPSVWTRSEERRVGKECIDRWARDP